MLEKADNVGGTWLFNRYPGARCDIESIEDSYSFSDEIQQEWVWTETMPAQPEIEAYLHFVADRLDLRRDISSAPRSSDDLDEDAAAWLLQTDGGETFTVPYVVAASGILSVPLEPDITGMDTLAGTSLFTSRWPRRMSTCAGKRVGVIGTGSTGVQLIPVVARQAEHFSFSSARPPTRCRGRSGRSTPGELDELKRNTTKSARSSGSTPSVPPGSMRFLGGAGDDEPPAAEGGLARGTTARDRGERRNGRAQLG